MKIGVDRISFLIFIAGFCGFPLIAALSAIFSFSTNIPSIIVRLIALACALIILILKIRKSKSDATAVAVVGLVIFWIFYCIRIIYSGFFSNEVLSHEIDYYFIWAYGACAIPMFGLINSNLRVDVIDKIQYTTVFSLLFVGLAITFFGSTAVLDSSGDLYESGRLRSESLNPISIGHIGVTLLLLSIWALLENEKENLKYRLLYIAGLVIGSYLLIASNSRGPAVAAASAILFIIFFSSYKGKLYAAFFVALAFAFFAPAAKYMEEVLGFDFYSRIIIGSLQEGQLDYSRIKILSNVLNEFLASPFFGSGLEDSTYSTYPHNVIVESFMALGLIGGILFLLINIFLLNYSRKIYLRGDRRGWIALIFIQYFVAAQFSGAIYSSVGYWLVVGLLLSGMNVGIERQALTHRSESRVRKF